MTSLKINSAPYRYNKFWTTDILVLVSALSIVIIFFYAQYIRLVEENDQQAYLLAKKLHPAIEFFFINQPQASLTLKNLYASTIVVIPPNIEVIVPSYKDRIDDWQLIVSHSQGEKHYILSHKGIQETYQ